MSKRINIAFSDDDYDIISSIAGKKNETLSKVVRDAALENLKTDVVKKNLDIITDILTTVVKDSQEPQFNRVSGLIYQVGVASASSMYLNAEVVDAFLPEDERIDFEIAYRKARKKGISFMKKKE